MPEVGPDEILIRVESAGVGVWDPFEREGGFAKMFGIEPKFPYVLGTDGAGTVVAVGERVSRFKEGDRVYAISLANPKGGFYAEYAAVKADNASLIPDKLTTEQAGAMPVDAITALRGLDDTLGLQAGRVADDLRRQRRHRAPGGAAGQADGRPRAGGGFGRRRRGAGQAAGGRRRRGRAQGRRGGRRP